jgi:tRNA A-37 threonylcarbamoyl transferase component Bud32
MEAPTPRPGAMAQPPAGSTRLRGRVALPKCIGSMTVASPLAAPAEIAARAEAVLAESPARIQRIEAGGRFYWVKAAERLSLRLRLQKGDAGRAFAAERAALDTLGKAGLPVPRIVAQGSGYFVTEDRGSSLRDLLRRPDGGNRIAAFRAAGAGLADFHARGLSHGRPSIRDITWDGSQVSFLDFERYHPRRNTRRGHVQDLMILVFSAFAETQGAAPEIDALCAGYREADRGGVWKGAVRLSRRLHWLAALARPFTGRSASREVRAVPMTLAVFRGG